MRVNTLRWDTKDIRKATGALEGVRRALHEETDKDKPNGYTVGVLLDAVSVIADNITKTVYRIEEQHGIPDCD